MRPWDDNLQEAFDYITHENWIIEDEELDVIEANGYTLADFQSMIIEGFMQHGTDYDNEILPSQRYAFRTTIFELIDAMGYSIRDFDWQRWKEWMGYV